MDVDANLFHMSSVQSKHQSKLGVTAVNFYEWPDFDRQDIAGNLLKITINTLHVL